MKKTVADRQTAVAEMKKAVAKQSKTAVKTESKTENTERVVIDFNAVKTALATLDSRFTVYDDMQSNDRANYCSIRLILKDSSIDSRKVFCIYYNVKSVTIHCAVRFQSVCDNAEYRINKKRTEYTKSVSLDALAEHVNALIQHEIERLQMNKTATATEQQKATKKAK